MRPRYHREMHVYREAPAAPANSTVDYYPHGPRGRFVWLAIFCLTALIIFWAMEEFSLTEIRVHCARAGRSCSIITTDPFGGTTSTSIPLSTIEGVEPRESSGRYPDYYLDLDTHDGQVELGGHWTAVQAQQIADVLDTFFQTPDEPEVDILTNPRRPSAAAYYVLLGIGALVFGFSFLQTARIEVIWRERTFRLKTRRWPLPSRVHDFPLDDVRGAYVTEVGNKRRPAFGVALRIDGYEDVRLPGDRTPFDEPKRRFVAELQKLLRLRDLGGPTNG